MKKLICTLGLLIMMQTVSMCQWVNVHNGGKDVVSSGTNLYMNASSPGVYKSTNDGLNWNYLGNTFTSDVNVMASIGGFIFAGTDGNGVYRSTNQGLNWVQYPSSFGKRYYSFTTSGNVLYAGLNDMCRRTTDYGVGWTYYGGVIDSVKAMVVSGNDLFMGTQYDGIFRVTNNGMNWVAVNNGLGNLQINALALSGTTLYAATGNDQNGTGRGLYKSTNNGDNWTYVIIPGVGNLPAKSLCVSGTSVFVSVWNYVFQSTDGNTWINRTGNINSIVVSLSAVNGSLYAGCYNGLFRTAIVTSVEPSSEIVSEYSLSQNFPNPFNPSTKISFSIPKSELVTLKVYDALGKEVTTLVNEMKTSGTYSVDFSTASSGTYFYKLTAGDFTETKRMLLIK